MVLYGFLEVSEDPRNAPKVTIRPSFTGRISHFFGNLQILFVALLGLLKITEAFCKRRLDYNRTFLPDSCRRFLLQLTGVFGGY